MDPLKRAEKVAVVGVCTSGKSTLASSLKEHGFDAYTVAQEHSTIRTMWSLRKPDYVICLNVCLDEAKRRRSVYWGQEMLDIQLKRLLHAREHCDLFIDTSTLQPEETLERALDALSARFGGADCASDNSRDHKETA